MRAWLTPLEDGAYYVRACLPHTIETLFVIERTLEPECDIAKALQDRGIVGKCYLLDAHTGRPVTIFEAA